LLSKQLTVFSQDVVDSGWICFPDIAATKEDLKQCELDLLGLLGLSNYPQDSVLKKIQDFLRRVARRAVLDMHRAGLEDN
jgi:hypothetical protein